MVVLRLACELVDRHGSQFGIIADLCLRSSTALEYENTWYTDHMEINMGRYGKLPNNKCGHETLIHYFTT